MNIEKIIDLCSQLQLAHSRAGKYAATINELLVRYLSKEQYTVFCENISRRKNKASTATGNSCFSIEAFNNPVDEEKLLKDFDVSQHWTYQGILDTLKIALVK
jgi:hypothetical protein